MTGGGVQLRAARIVEVLWEKRSSKLTELTAALRHKLGRDILKDYDSVNIGQSAYFTGDQFSTPECILLLEFSSSLCHVDDDLNVASTLAAHCACATQVLFGVQGNCTTSNVCLDLARMASIAM
jgi:hypothetical protein